MMSERSLLKMYSIGSSTVMMCEARVSFTCWIIAARVEVLPQPAGPTTRARPWWWWVRVLRISGMPSSERVGIFPGIPRNTRLSPFFWTNALARKRVIAHGTPIS
jgi:hypothetical protein